MTTQGSTPHNASTTEWQGVGPARILDRVRKFNRAVTNPVVGQLAGKVPGMLVMVSHEGRWSGRQFRAPVAAQVNDAKVIIPLTYGDRADWVKNVLHSGRALIRHNGEMIRAVHPRIVGADQAIPEFPWPLQLIMRRIGMKSFMILDRE